MECIGVATHRGNVFDALMAGSKSISRLLQSYMAGVGSRTDTIKTLKKPSHVSRG